MTSAAGYRLNRDAYGLTERERQVRALKAKGFTQRKIAQQLGLSVQRVSQIAQQLKSHQLAPESPKHRKLYAWVMVRDGQETLITTHDSGQLDMEFTSADLDTAAEQREKVQRLVDELGAPARLVALGSRSVMDTLDPPEVVTTRRRR